MIKRSLDVEVSRGDFKIGIKFYCKNVGEVELINGAKSIFISTTYRKGGKAYKKTLRIPKEEIE